MMIWLLAVLLTGTPGQDDPVRKLEDRVGKLEKKAEFYQNGFLSLIIVELARIFKNLNSPSAQFFFVR